MKRWIFLTAFCMVLSVSKGFSLPPFYTIAYNQLLNENPSGFLANTEFSCTNGYFLKESLHILDIYAEPSIKSFTKTVRFRVEKMIIHNDGDNGAEGAGDFTWIMKVNGKIISEAKEEIDLKTGTTHIIDSAVELSLSESVIEKVVFEAFIIERDSLLSGRDDVLPPITVTHYLNELLERKKISESRRVDVKGSPDVEVFYTIEVMD